SDRVTRVWWKNIFISSTGMSLVHRSIFKDSLFLLSQTESNMALASSCSTPPSWADHLSSSGILFSSSPTVNLISEVCFTAISISWFIARFFKYFPRWHGQEPFQGLLVPFHIGPYDLPAHIAAQPSRGFIVQLQAKFGKRGRVQELAFQVKGRVIEQVAFHKVPPHLFFVGLGPGNLLRGIPDLLPI